jgi:enoyl-CoA hydratase/carnithine racemase
MTDATILHVERRPPAAVLTMNRPEKFNALSLALLQAIRTAVQELGTEETARVLILTGSEKFFSTGMDLDDLAGVASVADTQRVLGVARQTNAEIERCPKPVIAAISGYCLTGGLELAMACDVRVAAENAKFGITSAKIGSVAGMGGTQRLPRLVGPGKAKELLFSTEFIDAQEALRIGLVNKVVPAGEAVMAAEAMARVFAQRAPLSLWYAKMAVNVGMNMDLESALSFESGLTAQLFTTEDKAEGMRAFLEKRPARFKGR